MKDLTIGNERKNIIQFAVPMLIGNIFQQLYNVVDSIIVGQFLGEEALSAVGASFPVMFAIISLVVGIAIGSTIIIAQYFGAKDIPKIRQAIDTLFIVVFLSSFLIAGAGLLFSEDIFLMIKLPEEVIPLAESYLQIILIGSFVMFPSYGLSAILRGLGDSKTPLYFQITATLLNIVLDLIFVIVFDAGIKGVAWATVISQGVTVIFGIIYLNKNHKIININFIKMKFDYTTFVKSFKIGLPMGLQHMFVALGMTALFRIVNDYGTTVIAAYTVAGRIDSFAILPSMNFASALSTFTGQNIGAGKYERVIRGLKSTLLVSGLFAVVFSAIVLIFARPLMSIFTPENDVIEVGINYLLIVSPFYIIFSGMFSVNAVFRGAGDTLIPMFITLMALWLVRVPISHFLSLDYGETGIWWGIPLAWLFGFVVSLLYYKSGRWRKNVIVKT